MLLCIAKHAVEADLPNRSDFQTAIATSCESIREEISKSELEQTIAGLLRLIEDYNAQASNTFTMQASKLRDSLSVMAETVVFLASGTETSVKQLGLIQSKLTHAVRLQDPGHMRACMEESIVLVISESRRVLLETRAKTEALKSEVNRLQKIVTSAKLLVSDDPITGLPTRTAAEQSLETITKAGKPLTVALFVLDRLVSINARFGRLAGDQVLVHVALTLAQRLRGATLYRWSGPAFLAVFDPSMGATVAERQAKLAMSSPIEKVVEMGERSAVVVVTCSLHVRSIAVGASFTPIIAGLDACLMAQEIDRK